MDPRIEILFEDNHLLVVKKPPGILSQPGEKNLPDMLTELKSYLKSKYDKPGNVFLGLVHRLDLNVGGVMVFARTSKAARRLSQAIRDHQFQKSYYAIVEGCMIQEKPAQLIDYLHKSGTSRVASTGMEDSGKQAILSYRSIGTATIANKTCTLVDIDLATGRFHQIRAQFAGRNHPLAGDVKYGSSIGSKDNELGLWAYKLSFPHPISTETITFMVKPEGGFFLLFGPIDWHV